MNQQQQRKNYLMRQLQAKKQLEELRAQQRAMKNQKTTGDKIVDSTNSAYKMASGANKAINAYNKFNTPKMSTADFASKVGATNGLQSVGQGMNFQAPTANLGTSTALTQAPNLQTGELASKIGAGSEIAKAGGNAGAMSGAMQGASKAMPVVGTVAGLASAGNNFAKGNNVDGALDLAKTGAMFIPGVGWAVSGAIQIAQMIKGMMDKKKQEANARAEKASQKAMQENMQEFAERKGNIAEVQAENAQAMQDQIQKNNADTASATGSDVLPQPDMNTPQAPQTPLNGANPANTTTNDPGTFKENMPLGRELNKLEEESPVDMSALGQTTSGSLLNAVDKWLGTDLEGTVGNTTPGAVTLDASPINRRDSQGQIVNNFQKEGVPTGMAMPVNYQQENMPPVSQAPEATQGKGGMILDGAKDIWDMLQNKLSQAPGHLSSGLNDFTEGYKDNTQTSFTKGDLANRMKESVIPPTKSEDGTLIGRADEIKKTLMHRLGELAGTGQRVISHPLTHAGVAGLVSKMAGGDIDDIAKAMFEYGGKKAEADRYYQQTTGKTDRPFLNTYGADDYKTKIQKDEMDRRQSNWEKELALREKDIQARIDNGWYKRVGRYGQQKYDPTTEPSFYDDYQLFADNNKILADESLLDQEADAFMNTVNAGKDWFDQTRVSKEQAKAEILRQIERQNLEFQKKYRINPMKGAKA